MLLSGCDLSLGHFQTLMVPLSCPEAPTKKTKKTKEPEAPILYDDPPDKMKSKDGRNANMKITSWNVDGLRAWVKKKGLDVSFKRVRQCVKGIFFLNVTIHTSVLAVGTRGESGCFVPPRDKVRRKVSPCGHHLDARVSFQVLGRVRRQGGLQWRGHALQDGTHQSHLWHW